MQFESTLPIVSSSYHIVLLEIILTPPLNRPSDAPEIALGILKLSILPLAISFNKPKAVIVIRLSIV